MQHSAVHRRAPRNLEYQVVVYDCREHGFYSIRIVWAFKKREPNKICIANVNGIPVNLEIEYNSPPTAPLEVQTDLADAAATTAVIEWLRGNL